MSAPGVAAQVLYVTPVYQPSMGGVETCVMELATRMRARGFDPTVLTVDDSHQLAAAETLDGVAVRRVAAWPRDRDYRLAPELPRAIRRAAPDVIHVQCYQTLVAPIAMAAAARQGIPYVLTFHGGGHSDGWRNRFRSKQLRIIRPLVARAAALIATAHWERESYSELLGIDPRRFTRIPNGADPLPSVRPSASSGGPLIVSLGRIERYKGHHLVLAAFARVREREPQARLWIAGEGPYEPELRRMARQLGVDQYVEIRSIHDRAEYLHRLGGASVAVLLSAFETYPLSVLEAATVGVPTLVAGNSGLAEMAGRGYADAISREAGPEVHAAELLRLIRQPRKDRAPIQLASWEQVADDHVMLYRTILARGAEGPPANLDRAAVTTTAVPQALLK